MPDPEGPPPGGSAGGASEPDAPHTPTQREGAAAHAAPEGSADEGSGTDRPRAVPMHALPTVDVLAVTLNFLAAKAWEGMGLIPNPVTNKIQKDLDEARLAIDAFAAILEVLRARLAEQPRREMEALLTTLRLNFVEKSAG